MARLAVSLIALIASVALLVSGNAFLMTLVGLRLSENGLATGLIGWILVCYSIGFVGGTLSGHRVVERVGHIRAFAVFAAALACAAQLYPLALNAPLWAALRAFSGFAMAGLMIVMESWFSSRATNDNRARLFAVYQTVFFLATAAGQLLINIGASGGAGDGHGGSPFGIATLLITAAVVPLSMTRMPNPSIDQARRLSLRTLYRLSPVGLTASLVAGLLVNAFYSMAPVYADQIGLGTGQLSLFMTAAIVGAMLFAWPIGRLCDRFNRRRVLMAVVMGAAGASFAIPSIGLDHGVLLIAATGLYMGLTAALYPVAVAITNDQMPSQQITAASTTLLLAFGLGSCIGPVATSSVMDALGPDGLFVTSTVVLALLGIYLGYRLCVRADVPAAQRTDYVAASPDIGFGLTELDPRNTAFAADENDSAERAADAARDDAPARPGRIHASHAR